jgi:hypothetical protein
METKGAWPYIVIPLSMTIDETRLMSHQIRSIPREQGGITRLIHFEIALNTARTLHRYFLFTMILLPGLAMSHMAKSFG